MIGSYQMGWKHKTKLDDVLKSYYEWYVSGWINNQQLNKEEPPHEIC